MSDMKLAEQQRHDNEMYDPGKGDGVYPIAVMPTDDRGEWVAFIAVGDDLPDYAYGGTEEKARDRAERDTIRYCEAVIESIKRVRKRRGYA